MRRSALLCVLLAAACSEERTSPRTVTPPSGRDGGVAVERDGGVVPTFALTATPNVTFDVDPSGPDTQIHATVAVVRDAVWVAYNRPSEDGSGNFDVFVVGFGGDGNLRFGPTRINDTLGPNDIDPSIAVDGDRVLVVWQRDDQVSMYNLSIVYRILDTDGVPVGAETTMALTRDGAPLEANAWSAKALPRPGGGFTVSGAWGDEALRAFQLFTVHLDRDGVVLGDGVPVFASDGNHQQSQSMIYGPDGRLRIAWTEDDAQSRSHVYHTTLDENGAPMQSPPPEAFGGGVTGGPFFAANAQGQPWLAMHVGRAGGADILLKPADEYGSTNQPLWVGEAGSVDQTPGIAFGDTGGMAFWYRQISGFRNQLFVASVPTAAGETFGTPIEVPTDVAAAPYGATIVSVGGGAYFVAWSDAANPDYRVRARFVTP